jgi:hypothetical protein
MKALPTGMAPEQDGDASSAGLPSNADRVPEWTYAGFVFRLTGRLPPVCQPRKLSSNPPFSTTGGPRTNGRKTGAGDDVGVGVGVELAVAVSVSVGVADGVGDPVGVTVNVGVVVKVRVAVEVSSCK